MRIVAVIVQLASCAGPAVEPDARKSGSDTALPDTGTRVTTSFGEAPECAEPGILCAFAGQEGWEGLDPPSLDAAPASTTIASNVLDAFGPYEGGVLARDPGGMILLAPPIARAVAWFPWACDDDGACITVSAIPDRDGETWLVGDRYAINRYHPVTGAWSRLVGGESGDPPPEVGASAQGRRIVASSFIQTTDGHLAVESLAGLLVIDPAGLVTIAVPFEVGSELVADILPLAELPGIFVTNLTASGDTVYVNDYYRNLVWAIDTTTWTIRRFAGQFVPESNADTVTCPSGLDRGGYSGDGGPALEARFERPRGLAVDARGWVYIHDAGNFCIRVVRDDGVVERAVGVCGTFGADLDDSIGLPATEVLLASGEEIAIVEDSLYLSHAETWRVRLAP